MTDVSDVNYIMKRDKNTIMYNDFQILLLYISTDGLASDGYKKNTYRVQYDIRMNIKLYLVVHVDVICHLVMQTEHFSYECV